MHMLYVHEVDQDQATWKDLEEEEGEEKGEEEGEEDKHGDEEEWLDSGY